jgi:hypothetical protein
MPKRKPSSGPASPPVVHSDAQANLQAVFNDLDQLPTQTAPQARASLYEQLGNRYRDLHMYARCIQMFEKSLDEAILTAMDTERLRGRLAELYTHLLGEAGVDKARSLVTGFSSDFVIERWIKAK